MRAAATRRNLLLRGSVRRLIFSRQNENSFLCYRCVGNSASITQNSSSSVAESSSSQISKRRKVEEGMIQHNVRCYKELSKPVLSGLVVLSTSAGFLMSGSPASVAPLVAVCAGTTLQAWSANAFNQVWEVENDALMKRTKRRPLPSGRMSRAHAAAYASASGLAGTGILLMGTNPLTAALGALNIGMYTLMYTPMKTRSVANTWVGAVVGALPPIMGWTAATGTLIAPEPALLGMTLFYWQFPHFFSLAWRSRGDYAAGGYKMLPVVDQEGGLRTAKAILRHSLYLAPLPILASVGGVTSSMYAVESVFFNSYIVMLAARFYKHRSNKNAQKVFLSSLWYLPLSLALMVYHSKNWGTEETDSTDSESHKEFTPIDRFVDNVKSRLIEACPHELLMRGDIDIAAEKLCPPAATEPLRRLEKKISRMEKERQHSSDPNEGV